MAPSTSATIVSSEEPMEEDFVAPLLSRTDTSAFGAGRLGFEELQPELMKRTATAGRKGPMLDNRNS
jgi:hypothetical protein